MKNQKIKNRKITDCLTINVVRRTPLQTIRYVRPCSRFHRGEQKTILFVSAKLHDKGVKDKYRLISCSL
ncbi:hypothetical protein, partial [Methanosarcina sp. UBA411]|uniref:hypothetical protein n=1 Tax=Methanosarcina sp. UBA411 TaxID=1915589 RepID=UPI0025F3D01F